MERSETRTEFGSKNVKNEHSEKLGVDERIILKFGIAI